MFPVGRSGVRLDPPHGGEAARGENPISDQFAGWWSHAPPADRLRGHSSIAEPETLGALFLADGARLRGWAAGAPPLTDNFPRRISLPAQRDEQDAGAFLAILNIPGAVSNFASGHELGALWPSDLRARTDAAAFSASRGSIPILSLPSMTVRDVEAFLGDGTPDLFSSKRCSGGIRLRLRSGSEGYRAEEPQLNGGNDVTQYRAGLEMMGRGGSEKRRTGSLASVRGARRALSHPFGCSVYRAADAPTDAEAPPHVRRLRERETTQKVSAHPRTKPPQPETIEAQAAFLTRTWDRAFESPVPVRKIFSRKARDAQELFTVRFRERRCNFGRARPRPG